jgi:hypothetical protein
MIMLNLALSYIKNLFRKPEVKVGQRWQWVEFYNEEINPFDPKSGKRFIITVRQIKDGWMEYEYDDGSIASSRISKVYSGWILLAEGEKE